MTHLVPQEQALTGTRYPTLPGFYFYYPYPTRNFFKISGFRVVTTHAVFSAELYQ